MERELPELLTGRRGHACGGFVFEERNVSFVCIQFQINLAFFNEFVEVIDLRIPLHR